MRFPIRSVLTGLALVLAGGVRAQEPNPLNAVRMDRWADAQADAAHFADPVAEKLILYLRLRAPGAATVGRNRRLHAAQSRLARPGPAGTPP